MEIEPASATTAMEKNEQKTGRHKWFKRWSGDEKRTPTNSERKKRSGSVFARLCWVSKKKDKKKPEIELVVNNADEGDAIHVDQNPDAEQSDVQLVEAGETSVEKESESFPEYPTTDLSEGSTSENVIRHVPTSAEVIFNTAMADIKRDWIEFGNSLGIGDQEMMKVVDQCVDLEPEGNAAAAEVQVPTTELTPVDEDELEIKRMVDEAASLALQSCDQDLPSMLPVGTEWDTSKCHSLALMTRVSSGEEEGLKSVASAKGVEVLSSSESEGKNGSAESHTAESLGKSSSSGCGSASSFYSLTVSAKPSWVASVSVPLEIEDGKTTPDQTVVVVDTMPLSEVVDESVSLNEGSAKEAAEEKSVTCCEQDPNAAERGGEKFAVNGELTNSD